MRRLVPALALLAFLGGCSLGDEEPSSRPPQLGVEGEDEETTVNFVFPSSATRNTVRVGGSDAAADAAGVAGALFPATGTSDRPTAVVMVDQDDWQSGIAASVLAGAPIGAPILLSDGDELPAVTEDTLERLAPRGSDLSEDAQVIRIGPDVARPDGFKTALIRGENPYQRAAAIDRFFSAARGRPSNDVVLYSGERAEWAMPAAAWAARSGDAVLPVEADSIPGRSVATSGPTSICSGRSGSSRSRWQTSSGSEDSPARSTGSRAGRRWRTPLRSRATRRATSAGG
jgi:hypothetical protein